MVTTNESTIHETEPTPEEAIFLRRFHSGASCPAEIRHWLEVSQVVRDSLALFGIYSVTDED